MSRRTPWAYVCIACGHYGNRHGMLPTDHERFRCPCGCEINQKAPMSVLWDRPADETPFLPPGGDQT